MREELTNLLPGERKNASHRLYMIRLWSIATLLASFLILSAVAFRVPTYLYQYEQTQLQKQNLTTLASQLSNTQGKEVAMRFKAINEDIAYLARLGSTSSASGAIAAILTVPHQGITISGLSYTPAGKGVDGKMTLTGSARTRESLRQYVDVLNTQPYVKNADLPIGSYAKESDIPFTITLTGSLLP